MKTLKLLLCFSPLIFHLSLFAQSWQWAIKDSGTGNQGNVGVAMRVDSAGNSYVTGSFQGSTYFNSCGNIACRGRRNFFLAKYDNSGTCLWVQTAGANTTQGVGGIDIALDGHGNLLVTGYFYDSVDFGSTKLTGGGFFVAKYNNNGNIIWAKGCLGAGRSISVDNKGNVYTIIGLGTGNLSGCTISNNTQMVKLDSDGNCKWAIAMTDNVRTDHICTDSIGNSYVCGAYGDTAIIGMDTLLPFDGGGGFIAKYDSSGNCLWARADYADPQGIGIDKWDNIYLVAGDSGNIYFGCDTLHLGSYAYFIAKLDNNGNCLWAISIDSDNSGYHALHVKQNGTSDIVCSFTPSTSIGSCNFIGGPGIFIVGLDSAGNCEWSQTAEFCEPEGIDCDYSGNCYIAGGISGNTTFGSITVTNPSSTQSILVAKLGVPIGTGIGHSPIHVATAFNIYPNPSDNGYNLEISPNLLNSQLIIYDTQGRTVFQTTISQQDSQINIPSLDKGMYYVRLITPQGQSLEKTIVKQ